MDKKTLNILVVDDDPTQGVALQEGVARAGYNVVLCRSSAEALSFTRRMEFHCLLIDCMLPKMNGVDLCEEILKILPRRPAVFLISGIFKDRSFINEAIQKTKANGFVTKPFDMGDLLKNIEAAMPNTVPAAATPLLALYSSETFGEGSSLEILRQESAIHAFHLTKLFQRMQETKLCGELTLTSTSGDVSKVSFYNGRIAEVRTPDKDSYFGSIAVSHGFVSPEEVLAALSDPSEKKLGQKLIDAMSLSPHAIQVILEEQLALRLSQTIQDDMVSLRWEEKEMRAPGFTLAETRYDHLLEDWLESKFTETWMKSTLMQWGSCLIEGDYHPRIHNPHSIEEVFSDASFNREKDVLLLFHALMRGTAFLGGRVERAQDFSFLESRLDKMTLDFKDHNLFKFLGVSEKAQPRELIRAFEDLKSSFDPKNLPENCPAKLVAKCNKVFIFIQNAYATLSDDSERARYIQVLQTKRMQELADSEPIFRTAILELQSGHPKEAAKSFQSLIDRKLEFKDLRSYRIWAGLKVDRNYTELRLDHVPPEERHSCAYLMAKGVYYSTRGQYKKGLEAFRAANVLDPQLNIAKQELRRLKAELEKNKTQNRDILREITTISTNLFGKPKRSA